MIAAINFGLIATIFFGILGIAGALGLILAYVRGNLAKSTIETLEKNSSALEKRVDLLEAENKALNERLLALEETKRALTEAVTSRAEVTELTKFTQEGFKSIAASMDVLTEHQEKVSQLLERVVSRQNG